MPTGNGLPKVGEVWEYRRKVGRNPIVPMRVVVLERGNGDYWSLRYAHKVEGKWQRKLDVDAAYAFTMQELKYVGPAGPNTRQELGLPPAKKRDLVAQTPRRSVIIPVLRGVPDDLPPGKYDVVVSDDSTWHNGQYRIVMDFLGPSDQGNGTATFSITVEEQQ